MKLKVIMIFLVGSVVPTLKSVALLKEGYCTVLKDQLEKSLFIAERVNFDAGIGDFSIDQEAIKGLEGKLSELWDPPVIEQKTQEFKDVFYMPDKKVRSVDPEPAWIYVLLQQKQKLEDNKKKLADICEPHKTAKVGDIAQFYTIAATIKDFLSDLRQEFFQETVIPNEQDLDDIIQFNKTQIDTLLPLFENKNPRKAYVPLEQTMHHVPVKDVVAYLFKLTD